VALALLELTPLADGLAAGSAPAARLEPADAIVVLASEATPAGGLSDASLRRAVHGIRLHRRGLAPLLLLSGSSPEEARQRAALATELGVPPAAVLTMSEGRTTRQEVAALLPLLRTRGARRVLLVSDAHHVGRGAALVERGGLAVLPAPVAVPATRLGAARVLLEGWAAWLYYRLAGHV
jgi:uncharacterized SAM-binding protein YcdF (DUF218 family)